jgi:type I restriction enzyme S subunit
MELKKYKLADIADFNKSSISKSETFKEIIYLDTSSITENVVSGTVIMNTKEAPSRAQRKVTNNTIIYSTVRPRLKHYGILSLPQNNFIVSTGFTTIDIKDLYKDKIDPRYLYLLLTQPTITDYIGNIADTAVSAYPSINPSDLSSLCFMFPDHAIQKTIADIWNNYDRKIELNRAINQNLEAMAKQLYDYWFVQFDFPNENGRPYKSSGGKMVWNEKLKREIPKVWDISLIKDIATTYSGGTPKSTNIEYYNNGEIAWINSGELNSPIITKTTNYITKCGLENSSAKLYPSNSILVAMYGATAGKVSLLTFEACSNQAVCGVIPTIENMLYYVYFHISSLYSHFITISTGSARDNISQDTIKNILLPIPTKNILKLFDEKIGNIYQMIVNNYQQIDSLTKQRDELLPLLMNGQASVG